MSSKVVTSNSVYDPNQRIWRGVQTEPQYGPECSIGQEALRSLLKNPEHIAQICYGSGRQYTNREIATLSIRVAQHFKKLQIRQCEVVGLCSVNSDYVAPLVFGALLSGLTLSTLDPSFDKDGIKHIFSITKPTIMFCDGAVYENVQEVLQDIDPKVPIYMVNEHIHGVADITEFLKETGIEDTFDVEPLIQGSSQTAAILSSSGTTGLPKGVCMSHASLLNGQVFTLDPTDAILCFSTLYWASGLMVLLGSTIRGATRIISEKGFIPEDFFDIVEKYKVKVLFTPPSQMAMAVASPKIGDFDLSSVVCYICGGSALPYSLVEKITPYIPNATFITAYGMTELSGAITLGTILPGSSGQVINNTQVKVIDDNEKLLGPEEHGEICLRTLFPWAGYYGNREATEAIYEKDGWIHSGDIGYFDKEGNLFIVDRKKDIMKYNNFHFSPSEIESVISEIAGVAEVCVCGIPDLVSSYLPAAAVVKSTGSSLTEEEVYRYVAKRMAHFKHLYGGVYFVDQVPKTASGKNLRRKVVDICERLRNIKDQMRVNESATKLQNVIKI